MNMISVILFIVRINQCYFMFCDLVYFVFVCWQVKFLSKGQVMRLVIICVSVQLIDRIVRRYWWFVGRNFRKMVELIGRLLLILKFQKVVKMLIVVKLGVEVVINFQIVVMLRVVLKLMICLKMLYLNLKSQQRLCE